MNNAFNFEIEPFEAYSGFKEANPSWAPRLKPYVEPLILILERSAS
jgi:hypothetical protein